VRRVAFAFVLLRDLGYLSLPISVRTPAAMASNLVGEFRHSPDVWFQDGTLVVCAGGTLFRVYSGILASQSEIFKDMLAVPQPEQPEVYDSCPVVRVQDSAEAMCCFLKVLHDTKCALDDTISLRLLMNTSHFSKNCEYSVTHISALLRLAIKYDANELRARVLGHLDQIFSTSSSVIDYNFAQPRRLRFDAFDMIAMCNLANELKLERLAASLSYTCATTLSLKETIEGCRCDDRVAELDPSSKRAVLELRTSIVKELDYFFPPWDEDTNTTTWSDKCSHQQSCRRKHRIIKEAVYRLDWDQRITLPPWSCQVVTESLAQKVNTCKSCKKALAQRYRAMRQNLWTRVPGLLGMRESWAP
jgi:hypothetical protein